MHRSSLVGAGGTAGSSSSTAISRSELSGRLTRLVCVRSESPVRGRATLVPVLADTVTTTGATNGSCRPRDNLIRVIREALGLRADKRRRYKLACEFTR